MKTIICLAVSIMIAGCATTPTNVSKTAAATEQEWIPLPVANVPTKGPTFRLRVRQEPGSGSPADMPFGQHPLGPWSPEIGVIEYTQEP